MKDSPKPPPPGMKISSEREPDTRYRVLLEAFHAVRKVDPYSPTAPTHIARRFDENREISEGRVKAMFEKALTSPCLGKVAKLIEKRLGRPLEPFDIWYNRFKPQGSHGEAELSGRGDGMG